MRGQRCGGRRVYEPMAEWWQGRHGRPGEGQDPLPQTSVGLLRRLRPAATTIAAAYGPRPPVRNCALGRGDELNRHFPMQHRRTGGEAFSRIDDGVGVDAVVAVEVGDGAGLAELLNAERLDTMAADTAEPAQRRRVAVDHGHDAAVAWQWREQFFDVAEMLHASPITAQLPCGGPTRMQTIRGRDREQADVAPALADKTGRFDRFRRDGAGIGDDEFGIGARLAQ